MPINPKKHRGRGTYNGSNPYIFRAVITNNLKEIEHAVMQNPQNINSRDAYGRVPSMYAAMQGNIDMLRYLSSQENFDPYITDSDENDLLYYSFWSINDEMVELVFQILHGIKKAKGTPLKV